MSDVLSWYCQVSVCTAMALDTQIGGGDGAELGKHRTTLMTIIINIHLRMLSCRHLPK
jgi:hypothetical protein